MPPITMALRRLAAAGAILLTACLPSCAMPRDEGERGDGGDDRDVIHLILTDGFKKTPVAVLSDGRSVFRQKVTTDDSTPAKPVRIRARRGRNGAVVLVLPDLYIRTGILSDSLVRLVSGPAPGQRVLRVKPMDAGRGVPAS
ncbi:MAG: hypothetical protein EOP86_25865, partial [Verrucomicrobiaceae bacterium]